VSGEPKLRKLLDVAIDAAHSAGAIVNRHFRDGVAADAKSDGTPVTVADRESERELRRVIAKAFPSHAILGEEEGETAGDADYRWIVDPIDGTKTFVAGVPLFGVLVGLEVRGDPVVGVIHLPALGETIAAARGEGCTRDGWPCHVSTTPRIEDALVVTTSSRACRRASPGYAALAEHAKNERGWGDCYGYALVASGRADVTIDTGIRPWDLCAVMPIVEEAGGRMTDWRGERTIRSPNAVATNGLLHDDVLAAIAVRAVS
jgi:histidinol phosphatase-like enzyme (inositol monophosphatase family)